MKTIIFLSGVFISLSTFAQPQQSGNVFLTNNSNPPVQVFQTNLINTSNVNDDNNIGNQMLQQGNFNTDDQAVVQSTASVKQSGSVSNTGISFNVSFSRSSSGSASGAKSHRIYHQFLLKLNHGLNQYQRTI
ncbi:MAG: hypothetical protein HY062_09380 [Bacteroidetes bacterium]|nr:hypothetical protein [Bacteroidota bacterium]